MNKTQGTIAAIIVLTLAALAGYGFGSRGAGKSGSNALSAQSASSSQRKVLYWKAPMDASFRSETPGKSPMGMDLVPVYANDDEDGPTSDVKINPTVVNNLGVRTAAVEQGSFANRIEAVGYVTYDEDTITSINTRADGWVETLGVKAVGSSVEPSQILYELFSPKLETAQREYQTALTSGNASLIAASRQRMRSLGFTTNQVKQIRRGQKISDRVSRRAPTSGVVVELNIREGAYVQPATQVMKLADLSKVWVQVEIDGSSAAQIKKGQTAIAQFEAFPDRQWEGTVDYIYPTVDEKTRTVKVRVRFENPNRKLQPNMYAHVIIKTAPQKDVVFIPQMALIRTGQSQRVVVARGDGRFDVCPVKAGASSGDRVEIRAGLRAGQRVVTSAQFMLDSEANIDAAALRLGTDKPGCTVEPASTQSGMSTMPNPGSATSETAEKMPSTTPGDDMSDMDMGAAVQPEQNKAEQP